MEALPILRPHPARTVKIRQSNSDLRGNELENLGTYSTSLHELLREQAHATPLSDDETHHHLNAD